MKKLILLMVVFGVPFCPAGAPITGSTTCPASGAKQINSSGTNTGYFVIQSLVSNTGSDLEIGGATVTTSNGIQLLPGQAYSGNSANQGIFSLANTYMACQNTTDTVRWVYY